ncbi:hypothetical protein BC826DRAFT_1175007 [Russula brevipes]|nr:hypothetical protein BC826DRAFT_1175007 [Russula brevipes]
MSDHDGLKYLSVVDVAVTLKLATANGARISANKEGREKNYFGTGEPRSLASILLEDPPMRERLFGKSSDDNGEIEDEIADDQAEQNASLTHQISCPVEAEVFPRILKDTGELRTKQPVILVLRSEAKCGKDNRTAVGTAENDVTEIGCPRLMDGRI